MQTVAAGKSSMSYKRKDFSGGYRFKNFQGSPREILHDLGLPKKVIIPLYGGFATALAAAVVPGDEVFAGRIIAGNETGISNPVLSTVKGRVEELIPWQIDVQPGLPLLPAAATEEVAIETMGTETVVNEVLSIETMSTEAMSNEALGTETVGPETVSTVSVATVAVVIESDGSAEWEALRGSSPEWEALSRETIEGLLYNSGVCSLGSSGIPTRFRSSIIEPGAVEHVVINGTEADVYNLSVALLLREDRLQKFETGIKVLHKIFPAAQFHLAVNRGRAPLLDGVTTDLDDPNWLNTYALKPKYPLGRDEVLIPALLDRPYPYGFAAAGLGVIVLDVQALLHVYDAVVLGKPLLERIITLSGPGFKDNPHLRVRIGTPVGYILENHLVAADGYRIVLNSAMSGITWNDKNRPVGADTSNLIALEEEKEGQALFFARPGFRKDSYSHTFLADLFPFQKETGTNLYGDRRACISCSFCEEVCPVGILPNLLHRYVDRDIIDEAILRYEIYKCIDCGLCSYVCPSKIPVSFLIKEGKERLEKEGFDPGARIRSQFAKKGRQS